MQTINYGNDGTVQLYHNIPSKAGTDQFECGGRVPLTDLTQDEEGRYVASCPVADCGTTTWVPLNGDTDAQRLHAHARLADPTHPAQTLCDAIESVLVDVALSNGIPSVELGMEALKIIADRGDEPPDPDTQPTLYELKTRLARSASTSIVLEPPSQ